MITAYKDLTIKKYKEIMAISDMETEDIDKQVKLISILSDFTEDDVYNLPLDKYGEYVDNLSFLFKEPKPLTRLPDTITLGDVKYIVLKRVDRMTAGQYIDLQTYMKENLGVEYILSTILIPKGKRYGDYDPIDVVSDISEYLDVETAMGIAFFLHKKLEYTIRGSLRYLDWMMRILKRKNPKIKEKLEEARMQLKRLEESGIGYIW